MELSEFKLFQASVEARFPEAYMLWDRAGALWAKAAEKFENLKMHTATPNQTVFRSAQVEFSVSLDRASCSEVNPNKNLNPFTESTHAFFRIVNEALDLHEYSRIGFRLIYVQKFDTYEQALESLNAVKILNTPPRVFNHTGAPGAEWTLRWKDEKQGTTVQLHIDERKHDFQAPLDWEGPKPETASQFRLLYDVDRYVHARTLVTQMSFEDWIKQMIHIINRDSDKLLNWP